MIYSLYINGVTFTNPGIQKSIYVVGVYIPSSGNYVGTNYSVKDVASTNYIDFLGSKRVPFFVNRGGMYAKRGSFFKYTFFYDGLKNSEKRLMRTFNGSNTLRQYYAINSPCSVIGIRLFKNSWKEAAGLTVQDTYKGSVTANLYLDNNYSGQIIRKDPVTSITLDVTKANCTEAVFEPLSIEYDNQNYLHMSYIMVELVASDDYSCGKTTLSNSSDIPSSDIVPYDDSLLTCIVTMEEGISVKLDEFVV